MNKLLRKNHISRLFPALKNTQQPLKLALSLIPSQSHPSDTVPESTSYQNQFLGAHSSSSIGNGMPPQFMHVYPNFPFGYCLNPISSVASDRLGVFEEGETESDDAGVIRADSVKKKRKRKMNKHKYKKLRKRLRRKSRA